jgi:hypothetical protein
VVNIRQHDIAAPILDDAAEAQFARDWQTYAKLVDHDYVSHREVYQLVRRFLIQDFVGPFRFLDLACGDARGIVGALQGTTVAHYHGVDLSRPALELAAISVEALHCPALLDQRDFVAAMADRPEPADTVWIGLSLHHLQPADKLVIIQEARSILGDSGQMLLYEPTCRDGENRECYLERFAATTRRLWTALSLQEWSTIVDHVNRCDFPETASGWLELGREAGFAQVGQEFVAPTDLYRLFRFQA